MHVHMLGVTEHPTGEWVTQRARQPTATLEGRTNDFRMFTCRSHRGRANPVTPAQVELPGGAVDPRSQGTTAPTTSFCSVRPTPARFLAAYEDHFNGHRPHQARIRPRRTPTSQKSSRSKAGSTAGKSPPPPSTSTTGPPDRSANQLARARIRQFWHGTGCRRPAVRRHRRMRSGPGSRRPGPLELPSGHQPGGLGMTLVAAFAEF